MECFMISAKFVPLKYYTLSSQLQRLTSFSVGCSGRRILSPGQIAVMRKWSIGLIIKNYTFSSIQFCKINLCKHVQDDAKAVRTFDLRKKAHFVSRMLLNPLRQTLANADFQA